MKRVKKGCVHCWHVTLSTTDGMAINGWDDERCCHCGGSRRRFWKNERDPAHGPYVTITKQVYDSDKR